MGFSKTLLTNVRHMWYHITSVQETDSPAVWRDVRVVEGTGLENRRCGSIRGFESHSLRHIFFKCILYLACRSTQVAEGAPLLRE